MIHVIAIVTTQANKRNQVLEGVRAIVPDVLAEDGCIEYCPVVDESGIGELQTPLGPDTYMVVEKWSSADALSTHLKAPHLLEFASKFGQFVTNKTIHVLTPEM